jgi:hypothetical protein
MVNLNDINSNVNENKWVSKIMYITDLIPMPLKYVLIFSATAFIGSIAAYYINSTGLLSGVLAVLIYYKVKQK